LGADLATVDYFVLRAGVWDGGDGDYGAAWVAGEGKVLF
jgi:hypothetical protein